MKWKSVQFTLIMLLAFLSLFAPYGCSICSTQRGKNEHIQPKGTLIEMVKIKLPGWKLEGPIKTYDKSTLFDYIDGGAELYFAYDFREVVTAEYTDGKATIHIDIYDMSNPESAFGIYSLNKYKDANYVEIGNEGILTDANLDFWKGRYFCKVYCSDASESYITIVKRIGNDISELIPDKGIEPPIVKSLPKTGLVKGTEKFFNRKLGLDNIFFLSNDNILNLDGETKGATGEYKINGEEFLFFIIEYPSPEKAESAFKNYMQYVETSGGVMSIDSNEFKVGKVEGKITLIRLKDNMLSGAWDIDTEEGLKAILSQRSW